MPKRKAAPKVPRPKQRRAPRGGGTVFFDARRGCWKAKVVVGRYPNGTTRYREVRAPTQAEAVARAKRVAPPDPNTVTVAEWASRWVAGLDVRPSTRDGYARQVDDRIVPALGHVKVAGLTAAAVRAAMPGWAAAGVPTANRTRSVGATMFRAAVIDGLAARNPFAECKRLKYEPKPLDPFSAAELRAVVSAYARYAAGPALAFLAATGARIGEAAALDVADYDPATGRVSITKTWSRGHGTRAPKSKHGRRTVTVPPPARPAVAAAIGARSVGPLFRSGGGTRYDSAQLNITLTRLLKALGLRRRNPHALRHGVATLLVSRGVPLGDVARFLGHTVNQVVRTYVHAAGTDPADAVAAALSEGS